MKLIDDSYISYVNLEHRIDRFTSINAQLNKHGLRAHRTPGIYPHERTQEKSGMTAMLKRKQVGALGCFLAQMDVMREAYVQDKHAFVLEDDVVFCADLKKRLNYIDKWTETHYWDVIWLGGTFHVNPPWHHKQDLGRDAECTDDAHMMRTYGSFCTYAYIVNGDSIPHVTHLLEGSYPWSIGIDASFIKLSPQLKTFAFVPGCAKQIDNESDQHAGAFTEFSRFSKLNGTIENSAYWFQDYMEDFDPSSFDWKEAK
jgi:GR25 family glycosyltransferase involved in LPS biosynthesis